MNVNEIKEALEKATPGPCVVDGCNKKVKYKGTYCEAHYKRLKRYGNPNQPKVKCKECDNEFEAYRVGQMFCGRNCKDKWKARQPKEREKQKVRYKKFMGTEKGKDLMRRTAKRMYQKHKHKALVRAKVQHAIKNGILIRPEYCESCGTRAKVEAHHHQGYDGANALNVKWICKSCHVKEERKHEIPQWMPVS